MLDMAMTDGQFETVRQRLRANGIELPGNAGTLSKDGVTAKYEHGNGRLRVEILERPFLLPLSLVEGRLQAYFEQSIAAGDRSAAQ